ncbi:MAG: DUF4391 domain-containing protein [Eubacteriales bacterium]|nr:DUF4391 domain-containing protein [Eubacteriales bacterium]
MYNLPEKTIMKKQLPKAAIYKKFNLNSSAKARFDSDISRMDIVGEISQATVSLPAGDSVSSIFVLQISLKKKDFDEKSITLISKLIKQKMIFVLEFENKAKLAVYYGKLFQTDWQDINDISIDIQGLNLDSAYQNMIIQIGDIHIENDNSLDEQIIWDDKRAKLEKEISKLEKQARAEKQPKKKFEIVHKINKMKEGL